MQICQKVSSTFCQLVNERFDSVAFLILKLTTCLVESKQVKQAGQPFVPLRIE